MITATRQLVRQRSFAGPSIIALLLLFSLNYGAQAQPSLEPGIVNTQNALNQIDNLLAQNQQDLSKLFAGSGLDILQKAGGVGAIAAIKNGYTAGDLLSAIESGDYGKVITDAAKLIAYFWGNLDPRVKLGNAGVKGSRRGL